MRKILDIRSLLRHSLALSALLFSACAGHRAVGDEYGELWIGKPLESFVSRYGKPASEDRLAGGRTAYLWNSGTATLDAPDYAVSRLYGDYSYKRFPGAGNINLMCEVRLVTGPDGIVREFNIMRDTPGARIGSRCREVLTDK